MPFSADHHRGEHRVAGQRGGVLAGAADHQRHDQRHLDDRHRDRQDQGAERLADPVRDHLGVVHAGEHGARPGTPRSPRRPRVAGMTTPRGGQHHQPSDGAATGSRTAGPGSLRSWGRPYGALVRRSRLVADGNQRSDGSGALTRRDRRVHPRPGPDDPVRADARDVPRRPRPDDRQHVDPHHRRRPRRPLHPGLGDHGVPDHLDDHHADLRQARRPLRPQEAVHVRDLGLHRRLGAVLVRDVDVRARGVPRRSRASAPAACSRWSWRSSATSCRRASGPATPATSWPMFGTSSVLGPVIGGFFAGQDEILGVDRLALGVPGERPDRHRRADRGRSAPSTSATLRARSASTGGAPSPWWSALVPLLTVAEQGREWGWGSPSLGHGVRRRRRSASSRSTRRARDGRRRADPAAAVPDPRGGGHDRWPASSSAWRCSAAS